MNLETVLELFQECKEHTECTECPMKEECKTFTRIIENITNPWELERIGFNEVEALYGAD